MPVLQENAGDRQVDDMSEKQIRQWEAKMQELLEKAGPHGHPIRTKGREVILEKDCARCRRIEELLGKE